MECGRLGNGWRIYYGGKAMLVLCSDQIEPNKYQRMSWRAPSESQAMQRRLQFGVLSVPLLAWNVNFSQLFPGDVKWYTG